MGEYILIEKERFREAFDKCFTELKLTNFQTSAPDPKYAENKIQIEAFARDLHRAFHYHIANLRRSLEKA